MSIFLNAATVAAGTCNSMIAIWDEERGYLYNPVFNWGYQNRNFPSPMMPSKGLWTELWTSPSLAAGDKTVGWVVLGQDSADLSGDFEPMPAVSLGSYRPYYFVGNCTDQNSVPLGGAVVKAYLTATDQMVGQTTTDSNGNYTCPTPYNGQNHYLVATIVSGTLAGVTINTLTPNF